MSLPLLIACTLVGFIFVLILSLDNLIDQRARLRTQKLLVTSPKKKPHPWRKRWEDLSHLVKPPDFFHTWVQTINLQWAGLPFSDEKLAIAWWLLILAGFGVGFTILVLCAWSGAILAGAMMVIFLAGAIPYLWIRWRIRGRAREITYSLPDFLDLLTFTVEAGLGFTPALQRVSEGYPGPLGEELRRVLAQLELGFSRAEALDEFAHRSPSPDVQNFVEAVKLTETLGTSLARTMRVQAEMLRLSRRQRAEAAAQTAPIRIIPALVFFFLPSLLLIYLAPPVINFLLRR